MSSVFEQLSRMVASDKEPTLTGAEIDDLLAMFARPDKNGITPDKPEWIPTYLMRAAAAEGWRWKAAKASELISTDLDGDRMSSDQIFNHCQRMIKLYSPAASVSTSGNATK